MEFSKSEKLYQKGLNHLVGGVNSPVRAFSSVGGNPLFIKNFRSILKGKYNLINQNLKNGTYYSRNSVVYSKLVNIKLKKHTLTNHNFIRALIFPPFQLPIVNGIAVKKSIFKKKKIILLKK